MNYANKFGDHNVGGLILFEEQYNEWDNFYGQAIMKLDGEYLIYGEKSNQIVGAGLAGDKVRQALVGRFNYDYKGRYMLDFSFAMMVLPVSRKLSLGILSCCICRLACQRRGLYERVGTIPQ
ncbi:MAG: hypothetical protein ACLUE2_07540 [Bacteroides cellulosilyticus]